MPQICTTNRSVCLSVPDNVSRPSDQYMYGYFCFLINWKGTFSFATAMCSMLCIALLTDWWANKIADVDLCDIGNSNGNGNCYGDDDGDGTSIWLAPKALTINAFVMRCVNTVTRPLQLMLTDFISLFMWTVIENLFEYFQTILFRSGLSVSL